MRNYTRSPDELLREHINRESGISVPATHDNVIFGTPTTDDNQVTRVNLRGVQDSEYRNTKVPITYKRLDFGVLFNGPYVPEFTALSKVSLWKLLPVINKTLGITLTVNDVQDIDIRTLGTDDRLVLTIVASPTSKVYSGTFELVFNRNFVYLTEVVSTTHLDALTHPDGFHENAISAGLLTWGQDYTLIQDKLAVDSTLLEGKGNYVDPEGLSAALEEHYGILSWPGNDINNPDHTTIQDMDTRDVPEANTNFQRVVVQRNIQENGYIGTAYFHYNTLA